MNSIPTYSSTSNGANKLDGVGKTLECFQCQDQSDKRVLPRPKISTQQLDRTGQKGKGGR